MDHPALTETTYYILLSLYHPQHGYGIMQETQQLSGGRVRLAAGTLYGALNALCEKGWISPLPMESGSRKKEYQLTSAGLKGSNRSWSGWRSLLPMAAPFYRRNRYE